MAHESSALTCLAAPEADTSPAPARAACSSAIPSCTPCARSAPPGRSASSGCLPADAYFGTPALQPRRGARPAAAHSAAGTPGGGLQLPQQLPARLVLALRPLRCLLWRCCIVVLLCVPALRVHPPACAPAGVCVLPRTGKAHSGCSPRRAARAHLRGPISSPQWLGSRRRRRFWPPAARAPSRSCSSPRDGAAGSCVAVRTAQWVCIALLDPKHASSCCVAVVSRTLIVCHPAVHSSRYSIDFSACALD